MNKNRVLSIIVILLIIIIGIMAYFLVKANKEKSDIIPKVEYLDSEIGKQNIIDNTVNENDNTTDNKNENAVVDETVKKHTQDKSFSDLMNLLYIKDKTKGKGNTLFYTRVFDECGLYDGVGETDIEAIDVLDKEISLVHEGGKYEYKSVKGIDGEVVSVKIDSYEEGIKGVVFLTRDGNVFYLTKDSIDDDNFNAKKVSKVSKVLKIEKVGTTAEDATGSGECIMAITYDGSYVAIGE